jgi:hypothetical protein
MRLAPLAFATIAAVAACVVEHGHSELNVINSSDFTIEELYVTEVGSPTWGPNLLGDVPLVPDASITLTVAFGTYDALLVDETGADCQLSAIDLRADDPTWVVTNDTCNVF